MRSNPSRVELFYAAKLIGLQARGISDYVLDRSCPPFSRFIEPREETAQLQELTSIALCFGLKLQEE